jgi:ribosomal protein L29
MATHSLKELRGMQASDLRKEIDEKRKSVAKMRLGLEMRSFKDSAVHRREKKEIARMLTVLNEKGEQATGNVDKTPLKATKKAAKVPARAQRGTSAN